MKFYVLEQQPADYKSSFRTDYLARKEKYGDTYRCKACGESIGPKIWLPPYNVELELWGEGFGDLAFSFAPDMLAPNLLKKGYVEYGLKGLEGFEPVKVLRIRKHKSVKGRKPSYFHAVVAYGRAIIDDIKSGIEREEAPICNECRVGGLIKRAKGIIVDSSTWSGEDIFIARGLPGIFLTTDHFKAFCQKYETKNTVFIPAEEYSYDFYPWEKERTRKTLEG